MPFLSDMRLLIVSFRSTLSCSECCLFLAPIYSVLTRVLRFTKHVKLSSLTSSSADSGSYLATQRIHYQEWPFTLTWLQLRQARLLFPIAVYSATHESFPVKLFHATVALCENLLNLVRTAVL